jgi:hypothetical protein
VSSSASVPSNVDRAALIDRINESGSKIGLLLDSLEFFEPYDQVEWENDEQQKNFDSLAEESGETMDLIMSELYWYSEE